MIHTRVITHDQPSLARVYDRNRNPLMYLVDTFVPDAPLTNHLGAPRVAFLPVEAITADQLALGVVPAKIVNATR